jgi:EAL domain-containing protein (putative c-di-GMP-specific phosphodiesterase class I)
MPFNELKIDKSLVFEIPASREARTMVSSMVDLGHNLGLSVSAEGAESLEVLNFLAANGCDEVQGFYISRAVPADEIAEIVSAWHTGVDPACLRESS